MHLSIYLFYFLFSLYYTPSQQVYCLLSCDCSYSTEPSVRFIEGDDCCDGSTSAALRANINISNRTDCTPCQSKCTPPTSPCFIHEYTQEFSTRITRPSHRKFLFTIPSPTVTCSMNTISSFIRGATQNDVSISVQADNGVVFLNRNLDVGSYSGTIVVQIFVSNLIDRVVIPITYEVYDAVTLNETSYNSTAFNSAIGGQYLFTIGINEAEFSPEFSLLGTGHTFTINSTAGHVFTSTQNPPVTFGTYTGEVLLKYTHNTDSSLGGEFGVRFSFNIIYPVTLASSRIISRIPFPPSTPMDVLAFTIRFTFASGFSMDDFTYDFLDIANILKIDHSSGEFSFPFMGDTEVKRYPDSGNLDFRASYLSKQMYSNDNTPNLDNVYKRTIDGVYELIIFDPCGFSPVMNETCQNSGTCSLDGLESRCACNEFYMGNMCEMDVNECVNTSFCNSFLCTNQVGSYECNCSSGYSGQRCFQNVNECLITPSICLNGGVCIDSVGSYTCDCTNTGYSGLNCEVNVNECIATVDLCGTGVCQDVSGSYVCDCTGSGYEGANCQMDIDECKLGLGPCENNGVCTNTNGSFICGCANTGFSGVTCSDNIDECNTTVVLCNAGRCVDTRGSYYCDCNGTGFSNSDCSSDVNECARNLSLCNNGICTNTVGSYMCNCTLGFEGTNCGKDINECDVANICNNGTCINTVSSYDCECNAGFIGDDCDQDVMECDTIPNLCMSGNCLNTIGSYLCDCGASGYRGQNCTEDINECAENANICNNGTCMNTNGSYSCLCSPGFTGPDCRENINECLSIGICNNGSCVDVNGSFYCVCQPGFSRSLCSEDIDECTVNSNLCNNGTCVNSFGSFDCDCDPGFMGDLCEVDINECNTIPSLCLPGSCSNTRGRYACECSGTGFMGVNCTEDINECANPVLCMPGVCVNSLGSYSCNCTDTGYTGVNCEVDINECALHSNLCGNGNCLNNQGSFSCNCANTGFVGDRCDIDIDECSLYTPCRNSGGCNNTVGSYSCDCTSTGYVGVNCTQDVDECMVVGICNLGTCRNNPGNYSCMCPEGVTGLNCNMSTGGMLICPANKTCTSDSECQDCLCHRNFSYISPVYVLLSRGIEFDGNTILPFEREIQPEMRGDVTIFARLRQSYPDRGYVMFIGSSTDYRNLGLFLDSNTSSAYIFYTRPGAITYSSVRVALEVMGPSMHTIAAVLNFTSSQVHFYKDGAFVISQTLTGPPDYRLGERRNSRVMYVGGRIENAFKFRGGIEQVFVYPFALSQSQIQSLDQNGPVIYQGTGRCGQDVLDESCIPRPFYSSSIATQHHSFRTKTRCDGLRYAKRGLSGEYKCMATVSAMECLENADCPSGYACGEYLSRDGHSLLPAVFDPYFHGFKYALVNTPITFRGVDPVTISITKRPILTLDLSIFTRFKQESNNEGYVVAKGVSAHARDFGLYLRGTSDSVWFVYKSKTGFHDYAIFSNITVDDGNIHTMGVVLLQVENSRFVYLYVDGVPRGCVKINNRVVFTPEVNRLTVGGRPGNDKFNFIGVIYKLDIFDVALSHSVILDLHSAFSTDSLVRYCSSLQADGDECYIERRPPFFRCDSDLGCVPSRFFNYTLPVLPQQNICYGVPYTVGQCLSCNCTSSTSDQLVCGTNGVTYANYCFLSCAGAALFTQGACISYADRFDMSAPGE